MNHASQPPSPVSYLTHLSKKLRKRYALSLGQNEVLTAIAAACNYPSYKQFKDAIETFHPGTMFRLRFNAEIIAQSLNIPAPELLEYLSFRPSSVGRSHDWLVGNVQIPDFLLDSDFPKSILTIGHTLSQLWQSQETSSSLRWTEPTQIVPRESVDLLLQKSRLFDSVMTRWDLQLTIALSRQESHAIVSEFMKRLSEIMTQRYSDLVEISYTADHHLAIALKGANESMIIGREILPPWISRAFHDLVTTEGISGRFEYTIHHPAPRVSILIPPETTDVAFTLHLSAGTHKKRSQSSMVLPKVRTQKGSNSTNRDRMIYDQPGIVAGLSAKAKWVTKPDMEYDRSSWKLARKGRVMTIPPSPEGGHVLVAGTPGSGNTVSVEIPTVMNYPHSMIILDCRRQMYEATHEYRSDVGTIIDLHLDPNVANVSELISRMASGLQKFDEIDSIVTYYLTYDPFNGLPMQTVVQQLIPLLLQRRNPARPFMLMIPEFLRFGFGEANVPELETALRVFRKHGIQMMLGVHAVSQMRQQFSNIGVICANIANVILLNTQGPEDAQILQDEYQCPLSTDEILRIPQTEMLLVSPGSGLHRGKKALYFKDKRFMKP